MTEILNPRTNRFVKVGSQGYKRLVRGGIIIPVESAPIKQESAPIKQETTNLNEPDEPEFNETKLQTKLAEISTDMIQKNMKKIVKNQKLSDNELDMLLNKMLYKKLCLDEPKPVKSKKGKKFKVVEPQSSSESD